MGLKLDKLKEQWARVGRLEQAVAVLGWDMETYMPEQGVRPRAEQLALLSELAHEWMTSDEMGLSIEQAENEVRGGDYFSNEVSMVRTARRTFDQKIKIPRDLIARFARATTQANSIWVKARMKADFRMHWSLRCYDALEQWAPGIRLLETWYYTSIQETIPRLQKLQTLFRLFPPLGKGMVILHYRLG